jgi:hypothetical protein
MTRFPLKPLALCSALIASGAAQAQEWQRGDQALLIELEPPSGATAFRFIVDGTDLSDLMTQRAIGQYEYDASRLALPSGELALEVYALVNDEWQAFHSQTLYILTPSGFEHAAFASSASIGIESQLDSGVKGDGFTEDNGHKANLQIGFSSEHRRGDFALTSNTNIVGTSEQEDSLRFFEKEQHAPKVDLSDYIVSLEKGNVSLSLGHISFGQHPLLLDALSHRGISANYQMNAYLGLGVSQQSGSAIVGWDNLLGITESQHRIQAASINLNLLPYSANELILEYTWMDGKSQSLNDFDTGEVSDIEEQSGWGLGMQAAFFEQRLRANAAYALSEFRNPFDPALAFFENDDDALEFLAEVEDSTDTAWQYRLEFDVLKKHENALAGATLAWQKQRADAQYRALAASTIADAIRENISLQGHIQKAQWKMEWSQDENNVDNIPSILKTQNKNRHFTINYALAEAFAQSERAHFWPTISINHRRVHQLALNNPDADISGFNGGSHLPDQVNTLFDFSSEWHIDNFNLGYQYSKSSQDNRQVGRELADFDRNNHALNSGVFLFDKLNVNASLGRAQNIDRELDSTFYNRNGSINVSLTLNSGWALDAGWSYNRDFTSLGDSESKSQSSNLGISKDWQLNSIFAQWSLRYARQKSTSEDFIFDFNTLAEDWLLTSSFNLTF